MRVCADNFVAETSREKDQEEQNMREEKRSLHNISHVLDPVFKVIVTDYLDENHFEQRMRQLWRLLLLTVVKSVSNEIMESREEVDARLPAELSKEEFCLGFNKMDFDVILHFSEADFVVITQQGGSFKRLVMRSVQCNILLRDEPFELCFLQLKLICACASN